MDPLTLVIIEDEDAHFQLMKRAVDKDFPLASVHHFEEASLCLENLDKISPDVIITDYMMSGMNGIEFLETLTQREKGTPVIMITGQGNEGVAVQAMKLGAADYVVKSADFFALLPRVIEKVIRERKLKRALEQSEERFKEIFEQSPIGIQLYDRNGLLLEVNQSCLDVFGIPNAAHIKGFKFFDDPNLPPKVKAKLLEGETVRYDVAFDFQQVKKHQFYETPRSGIIYLDVVITPIRQTGDDGTSGYLVQVQDVTERKLAEQQVRTLSHQLIKTQESERRRLSRDLHDRVAQDLSTLKIGLGTLLDDQPDVPPGTRQRVAELSEMVQATIMAVRDLAYDLRPGTLEQLGLAQTLLQHCEEFSAKTGVNVDFSAAAIDELQLDFDTKITLYRLIQEGLNNVKKHADATDVTVRLVTSFPDIILRIEDNGRGFDVKNRLFSAANERRMGLRSMEERAALLGGKMRIESRAMQGTQIVVEIPFRGKKRGQKENHPDC